MLQRRGIVGTKALSRKQDHLWEGVHVIHKDNRGWRRTAYWLQPHTENNLTISFCLYHLWCPNPPPMLSFPKLSVSLTPSLLHLPRSHHRELFKRWPRSVHLLLTDFYSCLVFGEIFMSLHGGTLGTKESGCALGNRVKKEGVVPQASWRPMAGT